MEMIDVVGVAKKTRAITVILAEFHGTTALFVPFLSTLALMVGAVRRYSPELSITFMS